MGSEARARLGLAGLLSVTLISFSLLYGQGDYPGPIVFGMLIAGGLVILMRRFGAGIPLTLVVSAGMLYWYLSLVFQAPNTFYGLPTIGTGRGLLESLRFALDKSYIDYAPVPIRPGYVIATIAIMWIATTIGEIATFRLRRPLLASLVPTILITFLLVVGTGGGAQFYVVVFIAALLTYWALESAHRLRSWGRWMSTWSHLKGDAPTTIAGGIARRMGASCVAVAIIAPLFLPYLGSGGITWRNSKGDRPGGGGGTGTTINLLASITPETISQSAETLFTVDAHVTADAPVYWRLASLSRFDGENWLTASASTVPVSLGGEVPTVIPPPSRRRTLSLQQHYEIKALGGRHLPAAVQPIDISYNRDNNLRVDAESADISMTPELAGGMNYDVNSRLPNATYEELNDAETGNPGPVYEQIPSISEEVRALRNSWIEDAQTPFERLIAIQDHLRDPEEFNYSLEVRPGASADQLTTFLTETKEGYCQQFATAFAVLSRSLGYPTRVSIGFLPGSTSPANPDHYTVTGHETHAWPEVFFEDLGWIPFEPTPRGIAIPPAYTSPEGGGPIPQGPGDGGRENAPAPGHRFADGPFADPFARGDGATPPDQEAPGAGDQSPAWRPAFARLLLIIVAVVLVWLVSLPTLKSTRVRRRYRAATSPHTLVNAAFAEFRDEAAELATRQRPSESAVTYAARVASLGVVPRTAAARLARLYETAEYSTREIEPREAEEAKRIAALLRASLWRAASVGQKARRLFSASELLATRKPGRLRARLRPATATGLARRV
jgi:transglutaminase-like putative cysteine protease